MFRSKIKIIFLFVLSLTLISFLSLFSAFVYYVPGNPVSMAVFKNTYLLFPLKKNFLEFYSPAGRNFEVNTRTDHNINQFLLQRIETTNDENEVAAIAHFYALQSKRREYDIFINVSDRIKPLILKQLVTEFDENTNLSDKIMLLETTRTGKRIGKGAIGIGEMMPNFSNSTKMDEVEKWRNERLVAMNVREKYQEWWNSNLTWEEKKKINPLEGTNIKVTECCG